MCRLRAAPIPRIRISGIPLVLLLAFFLKGSATPEQETSQDTVIPPRVEMLGVGLREHEWPEVHSGEKWWGLYETEPGFYELIQTTITVAEQFDACLDAHVPHILIDQEKAPLFMVRGLSRFSAGPVKTASRYRRLMPGEAFHAYHFRPHYDVVFALGNVVGPRHPIVKDYTINVREQLRSDGLVQEVIRIPETSVEEEFPVVVWIGDLDRDGRMDLLIDAQPYPGGPLILFLSSLAEEGEIVGKAAELIHRSC